MNSQTKQTKDHRTLPRFYSPTGKVEENARCRHAESFVIIDTLALPRAYQNLFLGVKYSIVNGLG